MLEICSFRSNHKRQFSKHTFDFLAAPQNASQLSKVMCKEETE